MKLLLVGGIQRLCIMPHESYMAKMPSVLVNFAWLYCLIECRKPLFQ